MGRARPAVGALAAIAMLVAAACLDPQDAPIAPEFRPMVESAKESLVTNLDGKGTTFVYRGMRCREDGGVLLGFVQIGVSGGERPAYAMSVGPPRAPFSWAGGYAVFEHDADPEIQSFFAASPEVPCQAVEQPAP